MPVSGKSPSTPSTPVSKTQGELPETSSTPTNDEIAERAFARYEARGGEAGRDVEDWLEAERELIDDRHNETINRAPEDALNRAGEDEESD
jgi:hypothetical protein